MSTEALGYGIVHGVARGHHVGTVSYDSDLQLFFVFVPDIDKTGAMTGEHRQVICHGGEVVLLSEEEFLREMRVKARRIVREAEAEAKPKVDQFERERYLDQKIADMRATINRLQNGLAPMTPRGQTPSTHREMELSQQEIDRQRMIAEEMRVRRERSQQPVVEQRMPWDPDPYENSPLARFAGLNLVEGSTRSGLGTTEQARQNDVTKLPTVFNDALNDPEYSKDSDGGMG